jgi:hypothetical protein
LLLAVLNTVWPEDAWFYLQSVGMIDCSPQCRTYIFVTACFSSPDHPISKSSSSQSFFDVNIDRCIICQKGIKL